MKKAWGKIEKPVWLAVWIAAVVAAGVFGLRPDVHGTASNWEQLAAPQSDPSLIINGVAMAPDPLATSPDYYAWAVGSIVGSASALPVRVAMAYTRGSWTEQVLMDDPGRKGIPISLNGVATWTEDRGPAGLPGDNIVNQYDMHKVWAVGGSRRNGLTAQVAYSEVKVGSDRPSQWALSIPRASGGGSDDINILGFGEDAWPYALTAVDFFDRNNGIAVGRKNIGNNPPPAGKSNCNIQLTSDGGINWSTPATFPPVDEAKCQGTDPKGEYGHFSGVRYARNYGTAAALVSADLWGNRPRKARTTQPAQRFVWVIMNGSDPQVNNKTDKVLFSMDSGSHWQEISTGIANAVNHEQWWTGIDALYYNGVYYVWIVGYDVDYTDSPWQVRQNYIRILRCTDPADPVVVGVSKCDVASFIDVTTNLNELNLNIPGVSPFKSIAANFDPKTSHVVARVAAGTPGKADGTVIESRNAEAVIFGFMSMAIWNREAVETNSAIFSVAAADVYHAFAGGDQGTILKRSSGNFTGAGWIGADDCSNPYQLGGVEPGCLGNPTRNLPLGWISMNCATTRACQTKEFTYGLNFKRKRDVSYCSTATTMPCNVSADCPGGGTCTASAQCSDPIQDVDVGALSGFAWLSTSDPAQQNPADPSQTCANTPSICKPIGWLSFDRASTGDPPAPPFNALPFATSCNKQINAGSAAESTIAAYRYDNGRIEGWGKFLNSGGSGWVKLRGPYRCGTAWCSGNRSFSCANDAACAAAGAGTCDTSAAGAAEYSATCPAATADPDHYFQCTDCQTWGYCSNIPAVPCQFDSGLCGTCKFDDPAKTSVRCNICTHVLTNDWWSSAYGKRKQLTVTASAMDLTAADTATLSIDLEAGDFIGDVRADYNDVRVVYRTDTGFNELPREIVKFPGVILEEIRFKLVRAIAAGATDDDYYLYYSNAAASAPTASLSGVYTRFDDMSSVPANVTTATTPWQADSQASGLFHGVGGEMQADFLPPIIPEPRNGYVYRTDWHLDPAKTWNIESDVRLITSSLPNIWNADVMGLLFVGHEAFNPPNPIPTWDATWLSLINATVNPFDRVELWKAGTGKLVGPVVQPVVVGTNYRMRWLQDLSTRTHNAWVDGQQKITNYVQTVIPNPRDTLFYPGFYAGTSLNAYDNLRVWQALGETVAAGAEELKAAAGAASGGGLETWSCNKCGSGGVPGTTQCGTGRCIPQAPVPPGLQSRPCLNDTQCGGGADTCQPAGHCSTDGKICWSDAFCPGGTCVGIGENVCDTCDSCSLYGASLDVSGGSLIGFGFSEDFGFVDLSYVYLYNQAWLQVLNGNVYAKAGTGSASTAKAPGSRATGRPEQCNATYAIRSNGSIVNFCSKFQPTDRPSVNANLSPYLRPDFSPFDLPQAANDYTTSVGKIDPVALTTITQAGNKNKYGHLVNDIQDPTLSDFWANIQGCLNNTVYRFNDPSLPTFTVDWTLPSPPSPPAPTFKYCAGLQGRGTFVIWGNLRVTTDMFYDPVGSPQNLSQIPSLGFIVLPTPDVPEPTITFTKDVGHSVGNFFTEGKIVIEAELDARKMDKQFVNEGVMVAKEFEFHRRYRGTVDNPQPSEVILNDGRLSLNPPPGFENFSALIPRVIESGG